MADGEFPRAGKGIGHLVITMRAMLQMFTVILVRQHKHFFWGSAKNK
jgi:hypothetical protein